MKVKNSDLLIRLGVGILIEGLILVGMLCIAPLREAIDSFLKMLLISFFVGCFIYAVSIRDQNKKIRKRS